MERRPSTEPQAWVLGKDHFPVLNSIQFANHFLSIAGVTRPLLVCDFVSTKKYLLGGQGVTRPLLEQTTLVTVPNL